MVATCATPCTGPGQYALQGGYFVPGGAKLPGGTWQIQSDGSIPGMAPLNEANDLMVGGENEANGLYRRITAYLIAACDCDTCVSGRLDVRPANEAQWWKTA